MIRLRAVACADGDALPAIFTESGVRQFLFDDILLTREQTQQHVEAAQDHAGWAICQDDEVIGLVSLRPTGNERELMIVIGEAYWGRGVALEAAQAAMHHGFEVLERDRILASVDFPNERSHRLMARLGFVVVGESDGPKYRLRNYEALRRSGT